MLMLCVENIHSFQDGFNQCRHSIQDTQRNIERYASLRYGSTFAYAQICHWLASYGIRKTSASVAGMALTLHGQSQATMRRHMNAHALTNNSGAYLASLRVLANAYLFSLQ